MKYMDTSGAWRIGLQINSVNLSGDFYCTLSEMGAFLGMRITVLLAHTALSSMIAIASFRMRKGHHPCPLILEV